MKEKLKSLFRDNILWKLASLLLGLIIWAVITNAQNPLQTKVVNVPITYLNEEQLLAEENLVFMSGPETISIVVQARNSDLSSITSVLFRCEADLMDHNGGDIANQRVHVNVTETSSNSAVLDWYYSKNNPNITVVMDEQITKTFDVQLLPEDSLTEGLILEGSVFFDPATVTVTGPKTRFSNLAYIKAPVNMKELSDEGGGNIQKSVELRLYDANSKLIPNMDGALKLSRSSALMSATIDRMQTVTVIVAGTTGTPAEGYRFLASSVTPRTIPVQGLKSNVADFTELSIPAEAIDITGISAKRDYQIDISAYLPDGVKLSGSDGIVTVTIEVEPVVSRTFEIHSDNIMLMGDDPDLYEYFIREIGIDVTVTGFEEDLDVFKVDKLMPVIDVTDLEAGTHRVKIATSAVPGYRIDNADDLYTYVTIREREKPSESTTEPEEPSSNVPVSTDDPHESESVSPSFESESSSEEETGEASGEQDAPERP